MELIKKEKIFGKIYTLLGDGSSDLILNGKGNVKIRFGDTFLDLIKNGKVASYSMDTNKTFKTIGTVDTLEDLDLILSDGIYYVSSEDSFYIKLGGKVFSILTEVYEESPGEDNTDYTSQAFLSIKESQRLKKDQVEIARKNIRDIIANLTDRYEDLPDDYVYYVKSTERHYVKTVNGFKELYLNLESGGTVLGVTNFGNPATLSRFSRVNIIDSNPLTLSDGKNNYLNFTLNSNNCILSPNDSNTKLVLGKSFIGLNTSESRSGYGVHINGSTFLDGNLSIPEGRRVNVEDIGSFSFIPGFTGSGCRIYRNELGLYLAEFDYLTVRQQMRIYELILEKIRAMKGSLVISGGGSKITSVDSRVSPTGVDQYVITLEEKYQVFVPHDLVRCQRFTKEVVGNTIENASLRFYWVEISEAEGNTIYVDKSEFNDTIPAEGDEMVQMGNTEDVTRQNLIYLTASDSGNPYIDILSGVNTKSFKGNLRVRLGNLNGIVYKGQTLQGYGLFSDNVYLRGMLVVYGSGGDRDVAESLDSHDRSIQSLTNVYNNLKDQVDRQIEVFSGDYLPLPTETDSTYNEPASTWQEKLSQDPTVFEAHVGDTFNYFFKEEGALPEDPYKIRSWKWTKLNNKYFWVETSDSDLLKLQQDIWQALSIAESKVKTYFTASKDVLPSTPYNINDIWVALDTYVMYRCIAAKEVGDTPAFSDWEEFNRSEFRLSEMAKDGIITPQEKKQLKKDWAVYTIKYTTVINKANNLNPPLDLPDLVAAYDALSAYITEIDLDSEEAFIETVSGKLVSLVETLEAELEKSGLLYTDKSASITGGAVSKTTKDEIAIQFGYDNYAQLSQNAITGGSTLLQGGKISTNLIEADLIISDAQVANNMFSQTLTIRGEGDAGKGVTKWLFNTSAITGGIDTSKPNGSVKFLPDGTMFGIKNNVLTSNPWRFNSDGSGSVAFGAMSWAADGNVTFTQKISQYFGDITSTVINGGLITTGTLSVGGGNSPETSLAGITATGGPTNLNDVRFWAGGTLSQANNLVSGATSNTANFAVTHEGLLYARNANISGTINADAGYLGKIILQNYGLSLTYDLDYGNSRIYTVTTKLGDPDTSSTALKGPFNITISPKNSSGAVGGFSTDVDTDGSMLVNIAGALNSVEISALNWYCTGKIVSGSIGVTSSGNSTPYNVSGRSLIVITSATADSVFTLGSGENGQRVDIINDTTVQITVNVARTEYPYHLIKGKAKKSVIYYNGAWYGENDQN